MGIDKQNVKFLLLKHTRTKHVHTHTHTHVQTSLPGAIPPLPNPIFPQPPRPALPGTRKFSKMGSEMQKRFIKGYVVCKHIVRFSLLQIIMCRQNHCLFVVLGFPAPPFAGLRPPGFPDFSGMGMGLPGMMPPPFPPIPNAPGMSPFTSRTGGLVRCTSIRLLWGLQWLQRSLF